MSVAVSCIGFDCPSFLTMPSSEGIDQNSSKKIVQGIRDEIAKMWGSESITFGRSIDEAFDALIDLCNQCSVADWDGYGAAAITLETFDEAKKIIRLLPSSMPIPDIIAEPTGEIGFEWCKKKGRVLVISVGGKHRINYAGIFGGSKVHGSEYFDETLPLIIIEHFRRLYA